MMYWFQRVKYFVSNVLFKIRVLFLFVWVAFVLALCFWNTSLISVNVPFTHQQLFAPKFVFIVASYPVVKLFLYFFFSTNIPLPSELKRKARHKSKDKNANEE